MKNIANADRPKSAGAMLPPRPLRRSGKVAQTACNSDRREGKSCIPTLNQTFADSRILKISKFHTFRIAGIMVFWMLAFASMTLVCRAGLVVVWRLPRGSPQIDLFIWLGRLSRSWRPLDCFAAL